MKIKSGKILGKHTDDYGHNELFGSTPRTAEVNGS